MIKLACWNIYYSHKLVEKKGPRNFQIGEDKRLANIVRIIREIDPDVFGIVECMPANKLRVFIRRYLPGYRFVIQGDSYRLNIALLYKPESLHVREVNFNRNRWKDKLGDDGRPVYYRWTRVPLLADIKDKPSGRRMLVAVVHPKSKKTFSYGEEGEREAYINRKRIVAEGRRLHTVLWEKAVRTPDYEKFLVMGDINDGPSFDQYEARILRSGLESHIGRVYEPDKVLHSFVDLSDERGISTTPASWGAPQLDHILYSHELAHGESLPRVVEDSGRVRDDLVDFSKGSGKKKDSDHVPVEVRVEL